MTLKPVRKTKEYNPPAEMVGEDESETVQFGDGALTIPKDSLKASAEIAGTVLPTPHHDWIGYFGTDTTYGPDLAPLPSNASLFVVTGEFTKLNPARMTVGEMVDAKDKLAAPVLYRVA